MSNLGAASNCGRGVMITNCFGPESCAGAEAMFATTMRMHGKVLLVGGVWDDTAESLAGVAI